jgi:hypothetical protein
MPLVRFSDGQIIPFERGWLAGTLARAAERQAAQPATNVLDLNASSTSEIPGPCRRPATPAGSFIPSPLNSPRDYGAKQASPAECGRPELTEIAT